MNWKTTLLAAAGAMSWAQAAHAQQPASPPPTGEPPPAAAPQEGVRKFEPAFFARYSPVTAYDMVRQLPGFSIDNGDSLRGFGATAGNVLIDGRRPSSKNAVADELTRIASRDVERIELIGAAAAGDVDVRGYTELANVVLKPAAQMQTSSTWTAGFVYQQDARVGARVGGTRSWKKGDLGGRLNMQLTQFGERGEVDAVSRNAAGTLTSTRDEFNQQWLGELLINGTLNWTPGPRDTFNLTGRIMPRSFNADSGATVRNAAGTPTQFITDDYSEKDILYVDLGGDWEHRFSPQNAVKLILVNSMVNWRPQELFEQFAPNGSRQLATRINADLKRGEHVARGVWTLKPNDKHTVEMGGEFAFNYRDTDRSVSNAVGSGPFAPQFLPVASTRVEETRGEAFISDTWRIDPKLTLEMGFTYEASTITQTGDAQQERDFTYPKPRLVATWKPDQNQFRLAVERTVAQLDFSEFASTVQLVQNQLTVGNPNLEPEQTWHSEVQWKRPIGARGSIAITAFYDQVDDVQDFVVLNNGGVLFTGAGNLGEGTRWGGFIETTLPLDGVGIKGGILKFSGGYRDSEVRDPIGGFDREFRFQNEYSWNIDFRQDIPEWKLSWGGDYSDVGQGRSYRLNEIQATDPGGGDFDLFVETTYFKGITIRLAADNIGEQKRPLLRTFFTPSRLPGGVFSSTETRTTWGARLYQLIISGSF